MELSLIEMRRKIRDVYDSFRWKKKVNKMKADQVRAIYYSFLKRGMFDRKDDGYHQMTIAEYTSSLMQ